MNTDGYDQKDWPEHFSKYLATQTTHDAMNQVLVANGLDSKCCEKTTKPEKMRILYDWLMQA